MPNPTHQQDDVLSAIREAALALGHPPSRSEFRTRSGITDHQVLRYFPSWREAVRAAGLEPHTTNRPLGRDELLRDWAEFVRRLRRVPTRDQYRRDGRYSPQVFEKKIGTWSAVPSAFRDWAGSRIEWTDVLALISQTKTPGVASAITESIAIPPNSLRLANHAKLIDRPTYGNPLDFRGLRHEPVNEQGVVFLFGMVARELGYLVEAVQAGYPDCEAKRQIAPGKWQRVRVEFEF